ncbi:MAG: HU family DNA-binding protein [Prevotella sp.]|nr:HU family DNA-binding protein [Prevotella sp.]
MNNLTDLATLLSAKHGITKVEATRFITAMFEVARENLDNEGLVKVRGLGTFKVTEVKDRASVDVTTGERIVIEGHDKVSFTPDVLMKELVNKPFAHFETVVVREGVDFSAIDEKYHVSEKDEIPVEKDAEEVVETPLETEEKPVETPTEIPTEAPTETTEKVEDMEAEAFTVPPKHELLGEYEDEEDMRKSEELALKLQHTNRIVRILAGVIAILVLAGIFGMCSMSKKVSERDQQIEQFVQEKQKALDAEKAEQERIAKELEAYNTYDDRVIHGDYKIVGIEKEVTAIEGQTLKSISRMELGPGMDCYVQAVNPDIKMVLIGQQVKIPKLVHK